MTRPGVVIGSCQGGVAPFVAASPALPKSDRAALGLAIQRFGGAVEAYCLRDDLEAARYALAAGVQAVRRVEDVRAIDADVVLVGSGGAEPWGDLMLALLAEYRQGAMVLEVLDVVPTASGCVVTRDLGRGQREILSIDGPAVLGIAESAPQLLYVSRYRRQAVRMVWPAAEATQYAAPPVEPSSLWEPVRPRVKAGGLAAKTAGSASARLQALLGVAAAPDRSATPVQMITADAATCAQYLLRFLQHHGMMPTTALPAPAPVPSPLSIPPDNTVSTAPVWAPHMRGPRPLQGPQRGMERRPRPRPMPRQPATPAHAEGRPRGPRPVGQTQVRSERRPRPVDPRTDRSSRPVS